MPAHRRIGTRRARIHLPPLTAEEALLLADIFERGIRALWRAHGDAMADHLGCVDPDRMLAWQSPDDVVTARKPGPDEPEDF
jgi:hypothetical protein